MDKSFEIYHYDKRVLDYSTTANISSFKTKKDNISIMRKPNQYRMTHIKIFVKENYMTKFN